MNAKSHGAYTARARSGAARRMKIMFRRKACWRSRALANSPALRARIEQSRTKHVTNDGETRPVWEPDLDRIRRIVLKNARGHAYFEYGEPMLDSPSHIWMLPLESISAETRQDFEGLTGESELAIWPEVGSRMMSRVLTGDDMAGKWVVVQEGSYRYSVQQADGLRVQSVISEYLATEVLWEQ